MAKKKNDDPRWALSRRDFLRWTGLASAAAATPGLMAACAPGALGDGEVTSVDLSDLTVNSWRNVYRAADMAYFKLGLVNLRTTGSPPTLQRIASGAAFIVLSFDGQHVLEPTFAAGATPPAASAPVASRLAQRSRLVFAMPDSVTSVPASISEILAACRSWGLQINRNAVGWTTDAAAPGSVSGPSTPVNGGVTIDPLETAIEVPARLQLSPNQYGRFDHSPTPVVFDGRTELWHTRLGVSRRAGGAIRRDDARRTVRALARTTSASTIGPLTDAHRQTLVTRTNAYSTPGTMPPAVRVHELSLSALGGTIDVTFDGPQTATQGDLETWAHETSLGRDLSVRVGESGFVFPYGHRASLIEVSERAFSSDSRPAAMLYKRTVLVVREPERTYPLTGVPASVQPYARQMPFGKVRFLTREATQLPPIPDIPTPRTFLLDAEVVDRSGRAIKLQLPVSFLPDPTTSRDLLDMARAWRSYTDTRGQRIAVAPPQKTDDTTFTSRFMQILGAGIGTVPAHTPGFYPYMASAYLDVDAVRTMTGAAALQGFKWSQVYVDHGLPGQADADTHPNQAQMLLDLVIPNGATTPPLPANFGKQADRSGGFLTPSMAIQGLSRLNGAVSAIDAAGTAADGAFDAAKSFGVDIEGVLPKLFGCIELKSILGTGVVDKCIPRFVSKALTVGERLFADGERLYELLTDLDRTAGRIAGIVIPPASSFRASLLSSELQTLQDIVDKLHTLEGKLRAAKRAYDQILAALPDDFDPATLQQQVEDFVDELFPLSLSDLVALLDSDNAHKLYALYPPLEVPLRTLERVTRALDELVADTDEVITKIKAAYLAVLQGIEMVRDGSVHLDWEPPLKSAGPFVKKDDTRLVLSADVRTRSRGDAKAGVDLLCSLEKFDIGLEVIVLKFDKVAFRQRMGKKAEIDVVFGGIEFSGCLSFVNKLNSIIPMDGFSDPPWVDVSLAGLKAGFDIALPDIAVGMYAMQHMAISSELDVPFLGDALAFRFGFCSRENPFVVQVAWYAGGGFFSVELTPAGLSAVESAIEFGARLSLSLGVISGSIEAMGGTYFGIFLDADTGVPTVVLSGYLRLRGEVDVAGLISAGLEVQLEMKYVRQGSKNLLVGSATVKFHVSLCFFHKTFKKTIERKFAGGSSSHKRQALAASAAPGRTTTGAITLTEVLGFDRTTNPQPPAWYEYWAAFAA